MGKKDFFNNKYLIALYIVTFAIAFLSKIDYHELPSFIAYGIGGLWILIALVKFIANGLSIRKIDNKIKWLFGIFILPRIVVHIYSIVLYKKGIAEYVTRNTQTYLVILIIFAIIYIFERKTLKYTIIAAISSYSINIVYNVMVYGLDTIPKTLMNIVNENHDKIARLYEVHDYTFAIGYLLLFLVLFKESYTKKDKIYIAVISIFIILGFKRIQILGLILVFVYALIAKKIKYKKTFYVFTSIIIMLSGYLFVYLMKMDDFFVMLERMNVNLMGRNYYYQAVAEICEFSPEFLGYGRNFISQLFQTKLSYLNVGGVHSDILKYFAECGFVLFGLWMFYMLIVITMILNKKYGEKVMSCYYVLTVYTFILYFTDNVDTYFVSQFIYIVIIGTVVLKSNNNLSKKISRE